MSDRPCFVYRVRDTWGRLLYVGSTIDLAIRFRAHDRLNPAWLCHMAYVEVQRFESEVEGRGAESIAIIRESPHYNLRGTGRSERTPRLPLTALLAGAAA